MVRLFPRTEKPTALSPGTVEYVGERKVDTVRVQSIAYDAAFFEENTITAVDECFPLRPAPASPGSMSTVFTTRHSSRRSPIASGSIPSSWRTSSAGTSARSSRTTRTTSSSRCGRSRTTRPRRDHDRAAQPRARPELRLLLPGGGRRQLRSRARAAAQGQGAHARDGARLPRVRADRRRRGRLLRGAGETSASASRRLTTS